jgi:hypothetical protein
VFDTSWWSPSDLLALFAFVPPGQIVWGSDAPYGTPAVGAALTLRYALQAGLDADQLRSLAGEQLERAVAGAELLDAGPPPGPARIGADPLLERVQTFLIGAIGLMFAGVEPVELLTLAALACEVGDDAPQAAVCRSILALLEERRRYLESGAREPGRPEGFVRGVHIVLAAAAAARTHDVPLPPTRSRSTSASAPPGTERSRALGLRADRRGIVDHLEPVLEAGDREDALHRLRPPHDDETPFLALGSLGRGDDAAQARRVEEREPRQVEHHQRRRERLRTAQLVLNLSDRREVELARQRDAHEPVPLLAFHLEESHRQGTLAERQRGRKLSRARPARGARGRPAWPGARRRTAAGS